MSREAEYIAANKAAPVWNYARQCHYSLETELVDLPRFCAISKRVQQSQGKNIVYEVKRSESSRTSRYMNSPHYVCLFEALVEDGAYTQFWCSCGLAVRVGHSCCHCFAVLHHRSSSVGFHLGLFNPIFILKQFQTATEVLISAKCSSQRLPLPTVQVPVAIHATDDEIMLTDISSWADLLAKTKHDQIVRSLGNLHSRMRQYIDNVDRVATHLSEQGHDAGAFLEEEERLLNQFVDMRASSTEVHVAGAQAPRPVPPPVAAKRSVQPTVRKAAKRGDGTKGATKGRGRGQGSGSRPPLKEELNAALDLSDALTTVNEAPSGLSARQAAYNDHLHAHIHNMVDLAEEDPPSSTQAPTQVASDMLLMIQQVDTHLAQLYARTACGEQLSLAELHQCKQLLEWRAQVSKN